MASTAQQVQLRCSALCNRPAHSQPWIAQNFAQVLSIVPGWRVSSRAAGHESPAGLPQLQVGYAQIPLAAKHGPNDQAHGNDRFALHMVSVLHMQGSKGAMDSFCTPNPCGALSTAQRSCSYRLTTRKRPLGACHGPSRAARMCPTTSAACSPWR